MPNKTKVLIKRGLQKLQPKWKNPGAGKAFYLFGCGAVTMSLSLLAPFWFISDITEPDTLFTLNPITARSCSSMTLPDGKLWHRDLCCKETKTPKEMEEAAEITAKEPSDRSDKERSRLEVLNNKLPVCDESPSAGYCPASLCESYSQCETKPDPDDPTGLATIPLTMEEIADCKVLCTPKESAKQCKYYQHGSASTIFGLMVFSMVVAYLAAAYSSKAATNPDPSDMKATLIFGTAGFVAFIFGLLAIALFSPGSRGETAQLGAGFFLQVIGLCEILGGTITIFDAGKKDLVQPALSFMPTDVDDDANKSSSGSTV